MENSSRKRFAFLSSVSGVIQHFIGIILSFIYRTFFVYIFTKEYLGIDGLFTNILQLLSLADLGVGNAIVYRMYKPVACNDKKSISGLVYFYRNIYHIVFCIIIFLGLLIVPFLGNIVDLSTVPNEINIRLVFFLFVVQSAITYLFSYKQSILISYQKSYVVSTVNAVINIITISIKIICMFVTRKYEIVLLSGIMCTLLLNYVFSIYITKKYDTIFKNKFSISKNMRKEIWKDTYGLLCHKIGGTVVSSTDNIVISKYINLINVGLYSNYTLISQSVSGIINKLLMSFTPTLGNFIVEKNKEDVQDLFEKLCFFNVWIASLCSICIFGLSDRFIRLWLNDSFVLGNNFVIVLSLLFYIQNSRLITCSFINATGLFAKDKYRAIVESIINISVSIVLAKKIGLSGVLIGTMISAILTYFWREVYILWRHGYIVKKREAYYRYLMGLIFVLFFDFLLYKLDCYIPYSFIGLLITLIIIIVIYNSIFILLLKKSKDFIYFKKLLLDITSKMFNNRETNDPNF